MDCKVVLFTMEYKLSELLPDGVGEITAIRLRGPMRRRLMDLGFLPGVRVSVLLRGFRGGICAYGVCGSVIALRRGDADQILVRT